MIDVLVVYTPAARTASGGTSGILSAIDLDVSQTNQAYANSGAIQRIRLVGAQEIAYTETGVSQTDLERLQGTSDGFMDGVHALRNSLGADLVHLAANVPDVCGRAYYGVTDGVGQAAYGFGLTDYRCLGGLTFAHELGHNMGLAHDTYVSPGADGQAYPYAHGYVNQAAFAPGAAASKRWRDIMAYVDQCTDAGFSCPKVTYFSNPNNTYLGDAMGNASTADAVRALNNTRTTVANFRQASLPAISINDVSVTEGNSGSTNATFTVSLSAASGSTVTVAYATASNTATTSDYTSTAGTLTFPPGTTSGNIVVPVLGDTLFEGNESFLVNLSNASQATISDAQGVATIVDDDHAPFTDDPLTVGNTSIKAVHITELRDRINAVRIARGLSAASWSHPTLTVQSTVVRVEDISELRTAINQAYVAAGMTQPTYDDPILSAGTPIKAAHIAQLRAAVVAIE